MLEERKTIYLCLAHMSEEGLEQKYVKEAFDTNWVVPMGPNVNAFEDDLENFVNKKETGNGVCIVFFSVFGFDGKRNTLCAYHCTYKYINGGIGTHTKLLT